jgi:hypothetical protein
MPEQIKSSALETMRRWLPTILILLGLLVGYVQWQGQADARDQQLAEAVAHNSQAIDKLSSAMERMTDLLVNDARHDSELAAIRRDLTVLWQSFQEHCSQEER